MRKQALIEASIEENLNSLDDNEKIEAIKTVANAHATKQCQRSSASSIKGKMIQWKTIKRWKMLLS